MTRHTQSNATECVFPFVFSPSADRPVQWVNSSREQFASIMKSRREWSEPEVFLREERRSAVLRWLARGPQGENSTSANPQCWALPIQKPWISRKLTHTTHTHTKPRADETDRLHAQLSVSGLYTGTLWTELAAVKVEGWLICLWYISTSLTSRCSVYIRYCNQSIFGIFPRSVTLIK